MWLSAVFLPTSFRRVFSMCLPLLLAILAVCYVAPLRADDSSDRRSEAKEQFARAESLRVALEAKNERDRSVKDYEQVASAYRHVYLITPHANEVPTALKQAADTYNEMGQFDRKYFTTALETYEFLLHEYPTNRYREEALLAIAALQRNHLAQSNLARQAYENFLKQYPNSDHAAEARRALAEMDAEDQFSTDAQIPTMPVSVPPPVPDTVNDGSSADSPNVGHIRVWNADTYTRIVIDLGGQAKYQAARIFNPDRIYFDIENAKLSRELIHEPINVPAGGYLKTVRVAQNRPDVVRVVLDVAQVKDYSVFELANPDRLVVDVYGPAALTETASNALSNADSSAGAAAPAPDRVPDSKTSKSSDTKTTSPQGETATAAPAPARAPDGKTSTSTSTSKNSDTKSTLPQSEVAGTTVAGPGPALGPAALPVKETAAKLGPPTIPEPTHNGERSLTRALGLKTSRIVIDAGHGGRDTGTIGPSGLMEKDLSLDVARRLGKLIEDRLPNADVIYTRDDDSFVALEKRTAIANDAKADLFLSIHANSSDDRKVSGIETYYLNFNASADAMEVAARENALAEGSVHDLPDLVKKIADNEKIEESRDLAVNIQDSLSTKLEPHAKRDRGVRKAPFVVLIGANMPSVLAEVSFLSNPEDEQWLKKPDNRQRVAEGLYQGIQSYLRSTNSLASGQMTPATEPRATTVASGALNQPAVK
jgi:N-acetylmuramoyl-L-alanine amidase